MIVVMRHGVRYLHLIDCNERCPFCFGNNIGDFDPPAFGKRCVYQSVECHDCGKEWEESYKITGDN